MINAEKMSKSTGNFMTIMEAIQEYSADATRLALADAGDGLEDANFDKDIANASILRLFKEETWIKETVEAKDLRTGPADATFADRVFDNEIRAAVINTKEAYTQMKFKEGVRVGVYALLSARDDYRQASATLHRYVYFCITHA
jgi:leucyl-tRNA synthetase